MAVRWTVLAAGALFVLGVTQRPDAAVGLVVLGVLFTVIERVRPLRDQPPAFRRRGAATDAVHFVVDELLAAVGVVAIVAVTVPVLSLAVPDRLVAFIAGQHPLVHWAEALVLGEVAGYWGHRLTHEIPWLWRFHKVHHSSPTMDWLAPNRRHPVDTALARAAVAVPLLLLGFALPTLAAHFVFKRFQGLLVHANVNLRFGILEWFVATPHFHHWHHATDREAWNTNYSGQVPLVDLLFGTLHLPDHWPTGYGCGDEPGDGYLAHLAWPFQGDGTAPSTDAADPPTPPSVDRPGADAGH